jgi:hypothetical protein
MPEPCVGYQGSVHSRNPCGMILIRQWSVTDCLGTVSSSAILVLRTYAVWSHDRRVGIALLLGTLGQFGLWLTSAQAVFTRNSPAHATQRLRIRDPYGTPSTDSAPCTAQHRAHSSWPSSRTVSTLQSPRSQALSVPQRWCLTCLFSHSPRGAFGRIEDAVGSVVSYYATGSRTLQQRARRTGRRRSSRPARRHPCSRFSFSRLRSSSPRSRLQPCSATLTPPAQARPVARVQPLPRPADHSRASRASSARVTASAPRRAVTTRSPDSVACRASRVLRRGAMLSTLSSMCWTRWTMSLAGSCLPSTSALHSRHIHRRFRPALRCPRRHHLPTLGVNADARLTWTRPCVPRASITSALLIPYAGT